MKKAVSLILALILLLSLCACGEKKPSEATEPEETLYAVGDTVSSDSAELVLTSYEVSETYGSSVAESDGIFIIVDFTLKNIGKSDLGFVFNKASGTESKYFRVIPTIDYNDGYLFTCGDVRLGGSVCDWSCFTDSDVEFISDLKPQGKTATAQVAIYVPREIVENEEAPLLIKMSIPSASGENGTETFTYKVR